MVKLLVLIFAIGALILIFYIISNIFEDIFIYYTKNIAKKLEPSDYGVKKFLWLELRIIILYSIITFLILGRDLKVKLFIVIGGIILIVIFFPNYATVIKNKWLEKFEDQLEEALRLIVSGLRSGLGFNYCLRIVVKQMLPPLSVEFKRVVDEISLGIPVDEALRHLEERIPSRELKIFTSAVMLQKRTGGSLTDVLAGIADTIKSRRRLKRRIKTLTAEGRLSAIILVLLPFVLLFLLRITQPDMFTPMLETIPGIAMLFVAILLDIIAALWIKRIVTIEI
jgi:tight adherence protein B